jgi:hypothetical protein
MTLSPVIGENAPNRYQINTLIERLDEKGRSALPFAVSDLPFFVNKPNIVSS